MKLKVKRRDSRLLVKATVSSGENISSREIDIISQKHIRGFLTPAITGKRKIEYTGPDGVCLYERLKQPITQYEFLYIMSQIVDITRRISENNLFLNNLLLDTRYVFINEKTRELYFIYLPFVSNHVCVDILGFMESIIYSVNPIREQNSDYISKYNRFIKKLSTFNADKIDIYIQDEDRSIKRQVSGKSSGFMTDKQKDYYAHYDEKNDETALLDDDNETGLLEDENNLEEATGLLNEELEEDDDNATGLLIDDEGSGNISQSSVRYASLLRILTNETISVNKPVFRVGKERSYVDYFVSNNNNVSRSHADIITRGMKFFIMDLNSKNHTYINGQMIQTRVEFEIFDGDRIRLANEEFIFNT